MSPGTRPDSSGDAARRRRLQALAGATVHGSDGKTVGRVRDVYLHDATDELAAITVTPRQLSARSVLLPASAIAALPE
ncbi:MAG: PRC-barrel domain-containing protein, partial [Brachybacterium sp.]|nr:PRC-barrel domain-containing protein [Brachybacterium sp.]